MLDYIKEALTFNWGIVIIGIALAVLIFKGVCELWDWFFRRFEIETKSMKERRETKEQLKATADLAKTTAENLDKLETQHTKDEKEFRENLNRHMTESEKDRKALHQEMKQYSENRIKDREQSMKIQKELTSSMDRLAVMFQHYLMGENTIVKRMLMYLLHTSDTKKFLRKTAKKMVLLKKAWVL